MVSKAEFTRQVADGYRHLYDLVCLRHHPLAGMLAREPSLSRKEKALKLHRLLLDVIEELRPGPKASLFSSQARCYHLLVLRYVKALEPRAVAAELAIGRRHYYREHRAAMQALADLLWDRYSPAVSACEPAPASEPEEDPSLPHLELLRLEAARTAQSDRSARVDEVVPPVLSLLQEMLQRRSVAVCLALPERLPEVSTDQSLLRQVLLGALGYLIQSAESSMARRPCATVHDVRGRHEQHARIEIAARVDGPVVRLSLWMESASPASPPSSSEARSRLGSLAEMAALAGLELRQLGGDRTQEGAPAAVKGFEVLLPAAQRTLLVVDDNEDALEFVRRCLSPHHYRVVTARTAGEALRLARRLQPQAITLDLMMPDQDGWDVLQALRNQPSTRHIPVIVCSILRQKELAISMGAAAFLEKPVSEHALLEALAALDSKPAQCSPE